jgi:hypothetical protein
LGKRNGVLAVWWMVWEEVNGGLITSGWTEERIRHKGELVFGFAVLIQGLVYVLCLVVTQMGSSGASQWKVDLDFASCKV